MCIYIYIDPQSAGSCIFCILGGNLHSYREVASSYSILCIPHADSDAFKSFQKSGALR